MTNLVEKSLIMGFGVFVLIIFLAIIFPFFNEIEEIKSEKEEEVDDSYTDFIKEIDIAINYVIKNTERTVSDFIKYPKNFNFTILNYSISFYYLIDGEIKQNQKYYDISLSYRNFKDMPSKIFLLNVKYEEGKILVDLSE